jgi:signal transduction histidine kinase
MATRRAGSSAAGAGYMPSTADPLRESASRTPIGDTDDSDALEVIDRAVRKVLRDFDDDELDQSDAEVLERETETVADAIRETVQGRLPDLGATGVVDRLRLLRSLRNVVVHDLDADEATIVSVLRAIETVQEPLLEAGGSLAVNDVLNPFSRGLLAEVAHLLRSPLGSIVMLTDTLRTGASGPLTEVQIRQLGIVHRAALGIASVTGDLLVLVREDERRAAKTRFDVGAMLETVADTARPVSVARNSDLVVTCGIDGPRMGPAAGIAQALLGLTLRAAHRTRDGVVEVEASPASEGEESDEVVFTVRATGSLELEDTDTPGVAPALKVNVDTGASVLSDYGLGLAAAGNIVQSLGSTLSISAEPEELLLSFAIRLPAAQD